VRDGAIVARGVADDKADVMARIHALEAFAAAGRELPCSIVWLSEGAEEIGSRGLGDLLRTHRERFAADACLWESYLRREDDGRPEIGFGCRGMVALELVLRILRGDQHSAFAGVFRSAAAELARALAGLTSDDGLVTIDGVRDDAAPLEPAAVARLEPPTAGDVALDGVDPFLPGDGAELARRLVAEPTANIAGLVAGYTGDGVKTVLPAEARAKLDIRLVPDQRPERVVGQLRAHLDRRGFQDIEIRVHHSVPPARSELDFPLGHAVIAAAQERFGEPVVYPLVPGAGPVHVLMDALAIPTVMPPGSTRPSSGIHAVDERVRVDDYLEHVAFTIRTLELLAA
jgi:acetylornithine deacetylase/succinyl-diaminopimelate desuccinylase-like protein